MKQIPVNDCPSGPRINAEIAKVLGGNINFDPNGLPYYAHNTLAGVIIGYVDEYSTDISTAWELVEESDLLKDNYLTKNEDDKYVICSKNVQFGEWPHYYEGADENIALVICRSFLQGRGIKSIELPE